MANGKPRSPIAPRGEEFGKKPSRSRGWSNRKTPPAASEQGISKNLASRKKSSFLMWGALFLSLVIAGTIQVTLQLLRSILVSLVGRLWNGTSEVVWRANHPTRNYLVLFRSGSGTCFLRKSRKEHNDRHATHAHQTRDNISKRTQTLLSFSPHFSFSCEALHTTTTTIMNNKRYSYFSRACCLRHAPSTCRNIQRA